MEYAEAASITPTIELAKLALVTSKDEEEDEADKNGTVSSNDTDATLVDDPSSIVPSSTSESMLSPKSPQQTPGSILGKRFRDGDREREYEAAGSPTSMDLDEDLPPRSSSPSGVSDSPPPLLSPGSPAQPEASGSGLTSRTETEGKKVVGPPLPPRKSVTARSESVMMFGELYNFSYFPLKTNCSCRKTARRSGMHG
jgi:ubiquitin carboxyl-terminal hydrolase 25